MSGKRDSRQAHWRSPAKVNLCLRVVGRRGDGYHLLDSVFVPIDLYDDVAVRVDALGPGRPVSVRVECTTPGMPLDERNLAARAARALLEECALGAKVEILLTKRIPTGAGLGGGSGNAATVLAGLNARLGLAVPAERLALLAVRLGADVPFFLLGRTARVRGIGETLTTIEGWPDLVMVVAVPPVEISTARAFGRLAGRELATGPEPGLLAHGARPEAALLVNDLESVVFPCHPAVATLKHALVAAGAAGAVMSGSGSAVVGVTWNLATAEVVRSSVAALHPETRLFLARPLPAPTSARWTPEDV